MFAFCVRLKLQFLEKAQSLRWLTSEEEEETNRWHLGPVPTETCWRQRGDPETRTSFVSSTGNIWGNEDRQAETRTLNFWPAGEKMKTQMMSRFWISRHELVCTFACIWDKCGGLLLFIADYTVGLPTVFTALEKMISYDRNSCTVGHSFSQILFSWVKIYRKEPKRSWADCSCQIMFTVDKS